jgi:hypothetical protein
MKLPFFYLSCVVGALVCLGGIGCEQHPPSETIPGYTEKKHAAEEHKATKPESSNPDAPAYFPPKE